MVNGNALLHIFFLLQYDIGYYYFFYINATNSNERVLQIITISHQLSFISDPKTRQIISVVQKTNREVYYTHSVTPHASAYKKELDQHEKYIIKSSKKERKKKTKVNNNGKKLAL